LSYIRYLKSSNFRENTSAFGTDLEISLAYVPVVVCWEFPPLRFSKSSLIIVAEAPCYVEFCFIDKILFFRIYQFAVSHSLFVENNKNSLTVIENPQCITDEFNSLFWVILFHKCIVSPTRRIARYEFSRLLQIFRKKAIGRNLWNLLISNESLTSNAYSS